MQKMKQAFWIATIETNKKIIELLEEELELKIKMNEKLVELADIYRKEVIKLEKELENVKRDNDRTVFYS